MTLPEPFMLFDAQKQTIHWPIPTKIDLPMSVVIPKMHLFTEAQMTAYRDAVLKEALACYSPDDTATDWADKIKALKSSKAITDPKVIRETFEDDDFHGVPV